MPGGVVGQTKIARNLDMLGKHVIIAPMDHFTHEQSQFAMSTIAGVARTHSRTGSSDYTFFCSYVTLNAILRGCSGFARGEVQNEEYYRVSTPAETVPATKAHTWKVKFRPKKL
jgi:hypothetical protein